MILIDAIHQEVNAMTRNQLIDAIMFEVDQVHPQLDAKDRAAVLWRLRLSRNAVLREIHSTNAVQLAVARAYAITPRRALSSDPPRR